MQSIYAIPKRIPAHIYILIAFGIIITTISVANHYFFRTFAFDYAAYNFGWHDYAHLRVSPSPVYWVQNMSFLQDHLSFLFFIFIPLYWLLTPVFGTYALMLIQNACILFGGWAVYKLVSERTDNKTFGMYALLLYFLTYGRYSAFTTDVNLMIILASLVPVYLYFFEKKKYWAATLMLLVLLTGRESIPIWMVFVFAVQAIWYRTLKSALKFLAAYAILSILYFIVAYYILIPWVENPDVPFSLFNYSALGSDPAEALVYLLTHPWEAIRLLFVNHTGEAEFDGMKMEFYAVYFVSGAFVLVYRPWYFLFFVPIVMQKMYNDSGVRWGIDTYYSIEIVSLLPIAVFLTISQIPKPALRKWLPPVVLLLAVITTIHKSDKNNRVLKWYSSDKYKFYDSRMYKSGFETARVHQMLNLVPAAASVSASDHLAPHFALRDIIHYFPRVDQAQYLAVFMDRVSPYFTPEQYYKAMNDYIYSPDWHTAGYVYPVLLMQKGNISLSDSLPQAHLIFSADSLQPDSSKVIPSFLISGSERVRILFTSATKPDSVRVMFSQESDLIFSALYADSLSTPGVYAYTWDGTVKHDLPKTTVNMNLRAYLQGSALALQWAKVYKFGYR